MWAPYQVLLLPLLALLRQTQAGYAIDSSCNQQQSAFIQASMQNAHEMAAAGIKAATAPYGAENAQLIRNLFGADRLDWGAAQAKEVLGAIGYLRDLKTADHLSMYDVKIYCDKSRYKVKDVLHYYDRDVNGAVPTVPALACNVGVFAYTVDVAKHGQIQICPWFLDYAMKKNFQTKKAWSWNFLTWGAIVFDKKIANKLYTAVDLMSLFDKVLLHELAHVRVAGTRGPIVDVGGFRHAYGWKNCKKLSNVATNDDETVLGPERNADTFALFGSLSSMIAKGMSINQDGSFVGWNGEPGVPTAKRAFLALKRWLLGR